MEINDLDKKYSFSGENDFVGGGWNAHVYSVGDEKLAKISMKRIRPEGFEEEIESLQNTPRALKKINKEYVDHKMVYEASLEEPEFNIPEVFGMYNILDKSNSEYYPGLVIKDLGRDSLASMYRKIHNKTASKLETGLFNHAVSLFDEQKEIAKNLGLDSNGEFNYENAIWVPREEKVYLIDFAGWTRD